MTSILSLLLIGGIFMANAQATGSERIRARDLGLAPGVLEPGPLNAITDVQGVRVGHETLIEGDNVRTGVTVVIPAAGNLMKRKVPAAVHVVNGYGKMAGISQIRELGEIETPIVLTNTLNVAEGMAALVEWTLEQPGNEAVRSVNAVVGETNDGFLNDIRGRHLTRAHVRAAIDAARTGPVEEGAVGAGTGTINFGWKGGIGTSSRRLPERLGAWTVGVLVQTNFGGVLTMDGVPLGRELGQYYLRDELQGDEHADGSVMIVVACDAPLSDRNLERLARRAMAGLARTGASLTNGSGDYVIAFSTHEAVRRTETEGAREMADLSNAAMSPLFQAVAEATEEAIYNALLMAVDMTGHRGAVRALPVDRVRRMIADRAGR